MALQKTYHNINWGGVIFVNLSQPLVLCPSPAGAPHKLSGCPSGLSLGLFTPSVFIAFVSEDCLSSNCPSHLQKHYAAHTTLILYSTLSLWRPISVQCNTGTLSNCVFILCFFICSKQHAFFFYLDPLTCYAPKQQTAYLGVDFMSIVSLILTVQTNSWAPCPYGLEQQSLPKAFFLSDRVKQLSVDHGTLTGE